MKIHFSLRQPPGLRHLMHTALAVSIILLAPGCTDEVKRGTAPDINEPEGSLVGYIGCKMFSSIEPTDVYPVGGYTCAVYDYDGSGVLTLEHINAEFNCCQDLIYAVITIKNDTIGIAESEDPVGGLCDCMCLFDLNFEITDLPPGVYFIKFDVPYNSWMSRGEEPLEFTADLRAAISDTFCVGRMGYPYPVEPEAEIIEYTGCKPPADTRGPLESAAASDCLEYSYDGYGHLELVHVNAGFNCCPTTIGGAIDITGFSITILENEVLDNPCHCLCLFDVVYGIFITRPGEYTVTVKGLYLGEGDEPIETVLDLNAATSGTVCVDRHNYPW